MTEAAPRARLESLNQFIFNAAIIVITTPACAALMSTGPNSDFFRNFFGRIVAALGLTILFGYPFWMPVFVISLFIGYPVWRMVILLPDRISFRLRVGLAATLTALATTVLADLYFLSVANRGTGELFSFTTTFGLPAILTAVAVTQFAYRPVR